MRYTAKNNTIYVSEIYPFSLRDTLDCGQCFRFSEEERGVFRGVALGRVLTIRQEGDVLLLDNCTPEEWETVWAPYFDLRADYTEIHRACACDPILAAAANAAGGIRILRQEPWEALCSFIISQNNNIPRIKGIISRLCETFGEPLPGGFSSFPGPETLVGCSEADLAPLRCGFRWKYLKDAAERIASGELSLSRVAALPLDEAREALMTIKGVGPKVADCALLFGFHRLEAFPRDVWIKRIMARYFPHGLPESVQGAGGVVQQYLFHWARTCPEAMQADAG